MACVAKLEGISNKSLKYRYLKLSKIIHSFVSEIKYMYKKILFVLKKNVNLALF